MASQKKYKIVKQSFHSGNNENCYNYATVNFEGNDNKLKIITKSPITNILYTIYNKKFFECICSFKVSSLNNTKFFKKLFIQSALLVTCFITPNIINLDNSIINNISKIKDKLEEEGNKTRLEYNEYSNYFNFLTKKKINLIMMIYIKMIINIIIVYILIYFYIMKPIKIF